MKSKLHGHVFEISAPNNIEWLAHADPGNKKITIQQMRPKLQ